MIIIITIKLTNRLENEGGQNLSGTNVAPAQYVHRQHDLHNADEAHVFIAKLYESFDTSITANKTRKNSCAAKCYMSEHNLH